jgi:tetratricopeptide (TPR) repeat protein
MEFVILGPTALQVAGERVPLGAAKQRGMLAVLLYHVGRPVRTDVIIDQLWEDGRTADECRANLYVLASRIRGVLGSVGIGNALIRVPSVGGYRLDLDANLVDYHRFRRAVLEAREAARQNCPDTSAALLTNAIGLWQGEPLADLRGASAEHLRRHMKDVLLEAHKLLADSQLRIGQHQSVLARLEPLVQADEVDEMLAQYWIRALCADGREDEARTFLLGFRRRFRQEMQAEPAVRLPERASHSGRPAAVRGRRPQRITVREPSQLPKDITYFTGHDELLAELDLLTDPDSGETNVVVLSGMPGVGKTTLAVHWAHLRRHRFPDGQLYLNANAYGPTAPIEPDEALGRFLRALNVPPDHIDGERRREQLNQLLTGRRMLVLLDNVLDSGQARPLIPTPGTCVTLITSRNRLKGLTIREGVRSLLIPPLAHHECLELLSHIVGLSRARSEPDALRALARLSDGLPLALRIIGEHVAERPKAGIAELVEQLTAHLLDSGGDEDQEASLHTVFAWSYHALTADAARLFRTLSVHPGLSIGPEAAAAAMSTDVPTAERLLDALARAHLINHDTARRYRFHDLLRRYAQECARREESTEQRDRALRRLLDWYLLSAVNAVAALAPQEPSVPDLPEPVGIEPLTFSTDLDAMKWCEAERAELSAITRLAVSTGFHRHGWQIPGTLYEVLGRYGRQDEVVDLLRLAVSAAQRDGHRTGRIGTLSNLGAAYFALHNYQDAVRSFSEGLRLARQAGDVEMELACSYNLASAQLKIGKTGAAVSTVNQVLAICRDMSDPAGEAFARYRLGDISWLNKQFPDAVEHYRAALEIFERIGALRESGVVHGALAAIYRDVGDYDAALAYCRRALEIHGRTRNETARCDVLTIMTDVERELGIYQSAIDIGRQAVALSEEIADSQRRCRALVALADTFAAAGRHAMAQRAYATALSIMDETADPELDDLRNRVFAAVNLAAPVAPEARAS